MTCPNCGGKLVSLRTYKEERDHFLCVGCGKEFSTVPEFEEPEAEEHVEAIPEHLL